MGITQMASAFDQKIVHHKTNDTGGGCLKEFPHLLSSEQGGIFSFPKWDDDSFRLTPAPLVILNIGKKKASFG
jgi:hypothetical protein